MALTFPLLVVHIAQSNRDVFWDCRHEDYDSAIDFLGDARGTQIYFESAIVMEIEIAIAIAKRKGSVDAVVLGVALDLMMEIFSDCCLGDFGFCSDFQNGDGSDGGGGVWLEKGASENENENER